MSLPRELHVKSNFEVEDMRRNHVGSRWPEEIRLLRNSDFQSRPGLFVSAPLQFRTQASCLLRCVMFSLGQIVPRFQAMRPGTVPVTWERSQRRAE